MKLTRRELLAGVAAAGAGAAGIYELVERLGGSAPVRARAVSLPEEQHLLDLRTLTDNGVEVLVPPLHHEVVTATVRPDDLRAARRDLEDALVELEQRLGGGAGGLGVTVAWGLPYFRNRVPEAWARHAPYDLRARQPALVDARRFDSDPEETVLEENEVAVLLRSDSSAHVAAGEKALFRELDVFHVTSIRKGFAGGGFDGGQSLPKKMAMAAGIPGAELIPDSAELFLGFTSTQKAGLGPGRIANLETLGYTDAAGGYFHGGTHMHLSHIFEDLENWYLNFGFSERVDTVFRPGLRVRSGTTTVRQGPREVSSHAEVLRDYHRTGVIGHSAAIQSTSRLHTDTVARDGTVYRAGTAIPQRADFNTLDNPFVWSERKGEVHPGPAAGVHFVVFNPSSGDFVRNRLAMDGTLPDGTKIPFARGSHGQGINAVLKTTHRQNFLVPPRAHRSFPLAEL